MTAPSLPTRRIFIGISIFFLFLVSLQGVWHFYGDEDHTFDQEGQSLVKQLEQPLIENKLCTTENDCESKGLITYLPKKGGFSICIYGVHEKDALRQIEATFSKAFLNTPALLYVNLKAYAGMKHKEIRIPFLFGEEAVLEIAMKRGI
jgi:hypothetical protein